MIRTAKHLFCLAALLPVAAHAQIIMCKDAAGRTYTSDRPIMECADRPIREFGKNGMLRREIPAPLTAEQKRQKQAEEEKRKAEEIVQLAQKQADRALLAKYPNEASIDAARKRTLEIVQEQLQRQSETLAAAEKRQQEMHAKIALNEKQKNAPNGLQHDQQDASRAVHEEKKKQQDYEAEIAKINQQYDATVKRYRELNNRESTAAK